MLQQTQEEVFGYWIVGSKRWNRRKRLSLMYSTLISILKSERQSMVWLRQETHQPAETSREAVFQSPLTTLHTTSRFSSVSWSSLQTTSEPFPHLVSLRWIFREFQTPSIHIHPTYFSYKRTAKAKCKKKKKKKLSNLSQKGSDWNML